MRIRMEEPKSEMKTLLKRILPLFLAFLTMLPVGAPAFADSQHLNNFYWEGGPVDLDFLIENNVSTESWTAWYNAHEEWNEATNSPTEFIYTENDDIDNIKAIKTDDSGIFWDGHWTHDPGWPNALVSAEVAMNEYKTDGYAYYKRVAIAVHELGHTVGLGHYSTNPMTDVSIMYDSAGAVYDEYTIYQPTSADIGHANEVRTQ